MRVSVTLLSSPAFNFVGVTDFGHSNRCVVVSHCFNLHFSVIYDMKHLFRCLFAICISSLVTLIFAHYLTGFLFVCLLSFKRYFIHFGCS